MRARAAALVACCLIPATAAAEVSGGAYLCDRGVEVPATCVTAGKLAVAVLHVEGRQVALLREPAAYGARYSWPSGGSGHVWWTKGDAATLLWRDGPRGSETVILSGCARRG